MSIISIVNGKTLCKCDQCYAEFSRATSHAKKYSKHFCNNKCAMKSHTSGTTIRQCKICDLEFAVKKSDANHHWYCSHKCRAEDGKTSQLFNCEWCGKTIARIPSHIKNKVFCSCSCRAKFYIRQRQGFRRSHGEKFLSEIIQRDFPHYTLLENKKNILPSGYEIDIFIKDKNMAIELNGPCHYFNIYGEETLRGVQSRDAIKHAEIQQSGFSLIVLDISTISDRNKLEKFITEQYEHNIKPLL